MVEATQVLESRLVAELVLILQEKQSTEMGINNGAIMAVQPTVLLATAIQSPGTAAVHHRVGCNPDFTVCPDLYLYLSGISSYINKYTITYLMI